jgi:hypothetical protein
MANSGNAQEKIYFEPKFAAAAKQSQFIHYNGAVILETTPESKFDKYSRIIATKNYFVVCDYSAKKMLLFDKTGRFVTKIKNKLDFNRLNYNEATDRLEVVNSNKMYRLTSKDNAQIQEDYTNPKNRKYYLKYYIDFRDTVNFTVHKQKISSADILNPVAYTDGKHIVNQILVNKNFANEQDYELKIFKGDSLLKQYFPYKKKNDSRYIFDGGTVAVTYGGSINTRWITHPYDYVVYALQNDSLYKVYDFVLPLERAVPGDFFTREFQSKTEKDNYLRQNRKLIKQLYMYNLSSRYLSFAMQSMQYERLQFIFDTQTKTFYNTEKISGDSLTYYLPITKNQSFNDGTVMYARVGADEVLKTYEEHKKDNLIYPPQLEAYLKNATAESNPVLINFTYRN